MRRSALGDDRDMNLGARRGKARNGTAAAQYLVIGMRRDHEHAAGAIKDRHTARSPRMMPTRGDVAEHASKSVIRSAAPSPQHTAKLLGSRTIT